MSSWSMELGHKWIITFHYFGLSCEILRHDAKEYLLVLCHVRLVTWFLVALDTLNWHPCWFIGFPIFYSIVSNWGIPNPFSLVFKKLCLLSQALLLGSFQQMFLALVVCCRYTEVVLWSLQYGGQVKGYHSALCSWGLDIWLPVLAAPFHQVWSDGKFTCVRQSSPLQARRAGCHIGCLQFFWIKGLSERWMIVRRDEFSIGIYKSKNNSSNITNSINSCFQISHDSYMPQLQKEQYWITTHIFCPEVRRIGWIYHTCFKIGQCRLILYLLISTKMTSGFF